MASMNDADTLARYRDSIDNIDAALVFMLAERFKITQAVGEFKAKSSLPPADPAREERQIQGCGNWHATPNLILILRRNFCASSLMKSFVTISKSATETNQLIAFGKLSLTNSPPISSLFSSAIAPP
jgi:monofunctional chorismate mutase